MSDTFDHELDAFESAYDHGMFVLPEDIEDYPNNLKENEENDDEYA